MPVIDLNRIKTPEDRNWKEKIRDGAKKAKQKVSDGIQWVKDNPSEAAMLATSGVALLGGANKVIRGINRHVTARKERYTKERFIYDHSLNAYLETKRKLNAKDIDRINKRRRETGQKLSEVLSEMDLLKK